MNSKYIPLKEAAADVDHLDSINSFFVSLNEKAEAMDNLRKAISYELFGKDDVPLKESEFSKPLDTKEIAIAKNSYDYKYYIRLTFEYPKTSALGKFVRFVDILLENPQVVDISKNEHSIYFESNDMKIVLYKTYEKLDISLSFIVYYSLTDKSFKVLVN